MPHADVAPPSGATRAFGGERASSRANARTRISAAAELARPVNALLAAAGVVLGAWWAGGPLGASVAYAATVAAGLAALANAFNDYRDRDIDAIAHPRRPLPSRRATDRDSLTVVVAGGAGAVAASLAVSRTMAAATLGVAAVMIAYSVRLKRHGVAGNAVVALLASLPFAYGAWSVGAPRGALLLYVLAVPLHFARELAKDLDDAPGDALAGRRTLPVAAGARRTRRALEGAVALFALTSIAVFAVRGGALAAATLAPAVACCAAAARRAGQGAAGAPAMLKAAMVLAMVAAAAARAAGLV